MAEKGNAIAADSASAYALEVRRVASYHAFDLEKCMPQSHSKVVGHHMRGKSPILWRVDASCTEIYWDAGLSNRCDTVCSFVCFSTGASPDMR